MTTIHMIWYIIDLVWVFYAVHDSGNNMFTPQFPHRTSTAPTRCDLLFLKSSRHMYLALLSCYYREHVLFQIVQMHPDTRGYHETWIYNKTYSIHRLIQNANLWRVEAKEHWKHKYIHISKHECKCLYQLTFISKNIHADISIRSLFSKRINDKLNYNTPVK